MNEKVVTIDEALKNKKTSNEELFVLLRLCEKNPALYKDDIQKIKDEIIDRNSGLLYRLISPRNGVIRDEDSVLSDLQIALLRAIERFDVSRGYKWSTFLCTVLKRESMRAIKKSFKNYSYLDRHTVELDVFKYVFAEKKDKENEDVEYLAPAIAKINLTERERIIIDERYLNGNKTLKEIGKKFGVCSEAIRQSEKRMFQRLREIIEIEKG